MKRKKIINILIFLLLLGSLQATKKELRGIVVIIDPGHGGTDTGASGYFKINKKTIRVVEDEYCYDVALRLQKIVRKKDGIAILTIKDKFQKSPNSNKPQDVIHPDQNEIYNTYNGEQVHSGIDGLSKRIQIANEWLSKYPKHKVVFISLHFDRTQKKELQGVFLIKPKNYTLKLVKLLEEEFRKEKRLRNLNGKEYYPVVESGDKSNGIRDLLILKTYNKIKEKLIIEFGNFNNPNDVWRIRDYKVREHYAQIITRALIKLNQ